MSKFTLAVYDDSPVYVNRFLAFIKSTLNLPFQVIGFTSPYTLESFLSGNVVNILLLSVKDATESDNAGVYQDYYANSSIKRIVMLGEQQELENQTDYIFKYQSMRSICEKLLLIYRSTPGTAQAAQAGVNILGVYTLQAPEKRIRFALSLSKSASLLPPVLFIEPDRFSGLAELLGEASGKTLSDAIFTYITAPAELSRTLQGAVISDGGVDILSGLAGLDDMAEIDSFKWSDFINALADAGGYSSIVLDIPDSLPDLEACFNLCGKIYLCGGADGDPLSECRRREFSRYFESRGRGDVLKKLRVADAKKAEE